MPQDIIFDLGGVLLNLDMEGVGDACRRLGIAAEMFFVKTDAEHSSTVCQGLSASDAITAYQIGRMTSDEFVGLVRSRCSNDVTPDDIKQAWNSCLGTIPRHRLDMIKALRRRGLHTHLLSNTNDLHWEEIKRRCFSEEGYTCADLFDHVIVSHEVHLAKPDPAIYRLAVELTGSPANRCLFIDDAQVNVEAATREGLQGAWLDVHRTGHLDEILAPLLQGEQVLRAN